MTPTREPTQLAPRVLLGTYALDQHEVGALMVARLLRDAGAEVIYLGRFNMPEQLLAVAVQEDADVIGISCHSWEYLGYTEELLGLIRASGVAVEVVLGGSVITAKDAATLESEGVAAVVGPGAPSHAVVDAVWQACARRRSGRSPGG